MLLTMCVLFLMCKLRYLHKGVWFAETIKELQLKFIEGKESNLEKIDGEVIVISGLIFMLGIGMLIIELITFACLLSYDTYKWPTVFCITLALWGVFRVKFSNRSKEELAIAKAKVSTQGKKLHTKYGVFSAIIHCVYYGYMILVLAGELKGL